MPLGYRARRKYAPSSSNTLLQTAWDKKLIDNWIIAQVHHSRRRCGERRLRGNLAGQHEAGEENPILWKSSG